MRATLHRTAAAWAGVHRRISRRVRALTAAACAVGFGGREARESRGVTDARETSKILALALRIGEILLSSGAGAADVTATMLGITPHLGLRNADIDVTFTLLRMSYQLDPDEMPVLLSRSINQRDIDYDDLTRTQDLVDDILGDRIEV